MKLLAKPSDFYNVSVDVFGSATDHPTVTIRVEDESDDGIPPLCDKLNELIEKGFKFTKVELSGDMIGYKYFEMELKK